MKMNRVIPQGQQQITGNHRIVKIWPIPLALLIKFFWLTRVIPRPRLKQMMITASTGQMKYQSILANPFSQRNVVSLTPYQETNRRKDRTEKIMKLMCTAVQAKELKIGTRLAIRVLMLPLMSKLSLVALGNPLDLQRLTRERIAGRTGPSQLDFLIWRIIRGKMASLIPKEHAAKMDTQCQPVQA